MTRRYTPRPSVTRLCACNCGELVSGTVRRRFVNQAHKRRAQRARRKQTQANIEHWTLMIKNLQGGLVDGPSAFEESRQPSQ